MARAVLSRSKSRKEKVTWKLWIGFLRLLRLFAGRQSLGPADFPWESRRLYEGGTRRAPCGRGSFLNVRQKSRPFWASFAATHGASARGVVVLCSYCVRTVFVGRSMSLPSAVPFDVAETHFGGRSTSIIATRPQLHREFALTCFARPFYRSSCGTFSLGDSTSPSVAPFQPCRLGVFGLPAPCVAVTIRARRSTAA